MSLKASELHQCILCPYKYIMKDMKKHLSLINVPKIAANYPQFKNLAHSEIDDDLAALLVID